MMRFLNLLTIKIILLLPFSLFSQQEKIIPCYTDEYMQEYFSERPEEYKAYLEHLRNIDLSPFMIETREGKRIVPVVFHIIHQGGSENISEEFVHNALRRVNEDFQKLNADLSTVRSIFTDRIADMNMEFRLAAIDPQGRCTNGITRTYSTSTTDARDNIKNLIRWDNKKYFNVWVVKSIYNSSGEGTILGYSTLPWNSLSNPTRDGIVVRADVVNYNSRTITHEIGHFFGLMHPFQDACGGDCATTGDKICDTPPVAEARYGCDHNQNTCSNDVPNLPDMVENHMDYTNCRVMFTKGQKAMVDFYIASNYRNTLFTGSNHLATGILDPENAVCRPVAAFEAERYSHCLNTLVPIKDLSLGPNSMNYKWYFQGSNQESSTESIPELSYNKAGIYDIKLVVSTPAGSDSITKSGVIMVLPELGQSMSVVEGFEDSQFDPDLWYIDPLNSSNIGWRRTDLAKSEGQKSLYLNNFSNLNTNTEFSFVIPAVDVSGVGGPVMKFMYAHARKSSSSNDIMRIFASNNCGESWSLRKAIGFANLPTVTEFYTTQFFPGSASQWKEESLDLSNYKGAKNLLIKFVFVANGGNNIYIDNIRFDNTSSIATPIHKNEIKIYPNPAKEQLNIDIFAPQEEESVIRIHDLMGRELHTSSLKTIPGENTFVIDLNNIVNLRSGVYIINITSETQSFIDRFTIIR